MNHLIAVGRGALFAIGLALVGVGASAGLPPDTSPAHLDEFHCQYCGMVGENSHKFVNVDCSGTDNGCKDCHEFNACHLDTQTGTCDGNHNPCAETFASAVETVSVALKENDHLGLVRAVNVHQRVHWNVDRQLLQVLDCNGRVGFQASVAFDVALKVDEMVRSTQ